MKSILHIGASRVMLCKTRIYQALYSLTFRISAFVEIQDSVRIIAVETV